MEGWQWQWPRLLQVQGHPQVCRRSRVSYRIKDEKAYGQGTYSYHQFHGMNIHKVNKECRQKDTLIIIQIIKATTYILIIVYNLVKQILRKKSIFFDRAFFSISVVSSPRRVLLTLKSSDLPNHKLFRFPLHPSSL